MDLALGTETREPDAARVRGGIDHRQSMNQWFGACLALPLAWSLPEAGFSFTLGWDYAAAVALPTLAVAVLAVTGNRSSRIIPWAFAAGLAAEAAVAFLLYGNVWL